jgi:hypothetical protein
VVGSHEQAAIAQTVRVSRIIIAALMAGVLSFLAASVVLVMQGAGAGPGNGAGAPPSPFLSYYVAPPAVGVCLLVAAFVPRFVTARFRRLVIRSLDLESAQAGADLAPLLNSYRTQLIVSAALCEWAAFFATICYMIEGSKIALLVAAVALAAVALHFPGQSGAEQWLDLQRELIERERHGNG